MTALREPPSPAPSRRRSVLPVLIGAGGLLAWIVGIAIIGGLAGQQATTCRSSPTGPSGPPTAPGTVGQTLQGRVSWFGGPDDPTSGPTTASGKPVTDPGIAVLDTATLNGYWRVHFPNGRTAVLQQTDIGPAPWTGRVLDVLYSALPYLGYTEQDFPTGSIVTARYLGTDPRLARIAIHNGGPPAPGSPSCTPSGNGSDASVVAAANLLASMHVPYSYGGGHITPATPTLGLGGAPPVGLDCSSSVSFVLQHAGIHVPTMVAEDFAHWGDPGPGQTVTIYANSWHTFLKIGNRYFGTSGFGHPAAGTGPAWFTIDPSPSYLALFTARHPPGL